MNAALIDWTIIGPAFVAGLIVLSTHVPLGHEVLKRGIIFIDLAIAQIAGLGVIAAHSMNWEQDGFEVQLVAVAAALAAAFGLNWTEKRWPAEQEPLIGILFILAATGGILLLAGNPHGGEHLKELLAGQILWSTWSSLLPISVLYVVLLGLWFAMRDRVGGLGFYVVFAIAVTASVQIVGIYLVFASLIIPALATKSMSRYRRLLVGYALGALAYLAGIMLSAVLDLPTGALVVWTMAALALAVGLPASLRQNSAARGNDTSGER